MTGKPIPIEARGELDDRQPFDRALLAAMLHQCQLVADGVLAHVVGRPKWTEIRGVIADPDHRIPGAVGRWLDTLPTDRKVIVPAVVSRRLAGMLSRRGFVPECWWDDALSMEDAGAMIRRPS